MEPLDPKRFTINYSWTQPYASLNPQYAVQVTDLEREMIVIEAIDRIVQNSLTYPDAERIINKLMKENRHD